VLATSERNWQPVPASGNGYIEYVDGKALLRLATEHDTIVRMEVAIGGFVVQDATLVSLDLEEPPDESRADGIYRLPRCRYCNVEAPEALSSLERMLASPDSADRAALFREQLEQAIREASISPETYEALTGEHFDSLQELQRWLRQLWEQLYP
jgi:hypothetical protein